MSCHLQVVIFCGIFAIEFICVVPEDVPSLTNMKVGHLLCIDLTNFDELLWIEFSTFEEV